jgi:hypothetical protein
MELSGNTTRPLTSSPIYSFTLWYTYVSHKIFFIENIVKFTSYKSVNYIHKYKSWRTSVHALSLEFALCSQIGSNLGEEGVPSPNFSLLKSGQTVNLEQWACSKTMLIKFLPSPEIKPTHSRLPGERLNLYKSGWETTGSRPA